MIFEVIIGAKMLCPVAIKLYILDFLDPLSGKMFRYIKVGEGGS